MTCRLINATQVGGVIDLVWLVVVRSKRTTDKQEFKWPNAGPEVSRPMNNCLQPTNIPRAAYKHQLDTDAKKLLCPVVIPHCDRDPMPAWPGSWIDTPRGVRRLLNDELSKGQGTPKAWLGEHYPHGSVVRKTVAVHILEYLSDTLVQNSPVVQITPEMLEPRPDCVDAAEEVPFSWVPPDLSPTSDWTKDRVYNLIQAAIQYDEPGPIIEESMRMLARHPPC
jgi:hypothetical protein